jgi:hypothetical protein
MELVPVVEEYSVGEHLNPTNQSNAFFDLTLLNLVFDKPSLKKSYLLMQMLHDAIKLKETNLGKDKFGFSQ